MTRLPEADPEVETIKAIRLDDARWARFCAVLIEPARPMPRMRRLLREPGLFDRRGKQ